MDVGEHDDTGDRIRRDEDYFDHSCHHQDSPLKTEVANAVYSRVTSPTSTLSPSSPSSNRVREASMMFLMRMVSVRLT